MSFFTKSSASSKLLSVARVEDEGPFILEIRKVTIKRGETFGGKDHPKDRLHITFEGDYWMTIGAEQEASMEKALGCEWDRGIWGWVGKTVELHVEDRVFRKGESYGRPGEVQKVIRFSRG